MIWLCLLIPLVTVIFLSIKFPKRMAIWEYFLVFGVPLITIFIGKAASIHSQTHDTEYWNSYLVRAEYYEDWNEYVHRTCTRTVSCGENCTRTESYDCSYVQYHPEYWIVKDNIGNSFHVQSNFFSYLCSLWANKTFKDLYRSYHTNDGDMYFSDYDGSFEKTVPICERHTYENKVQCSKSVFNFEEVDTLTIKEYGLFSYPDPPSEFNYNPILGYTDRTASKLLQKYNAHSGKSRQLHMLLLVFKDKPYDAAMMQENYWKGGNKNEFIVCVGISGNKISWTKVISWTDQELLKVQVARKIKEMETFDAVKVADYMGKAIPPEFVRKQFKDFNYINVEPTTSAIIITLIITILVTAGVAIFSVTNDSNLHGYRSGRW